MGLSQQIGASSLGKPGVCTSTTRPATPYEGQMIYETDTDLTYIYNGIAFYQVSGGTAVGNSGLVYVTSATIGTTVSSVTVSSAFSSTYDNYKIIVSGGTASAGSSLSLQLGSSTTGYYGFLSYGDATVGTILGANRNNTAQMNWVSGAFGASQAMYGQFDLLSPFIASYTKIANATYQEGNGFGTMQGEHRVATSYTAFTLFPSAGTITGGTITVYGYRKA